MLRDGLSRVSIVARGDAYGEGLMGGVKKELAAAGMPETEITTYRYDVGENGLIAKPDQVRDIISRITSAQPDGVLVIGFEESAEVIKGMFKSGLKFRR
jgi:ABC-type branched-subunit amino acid transport system substrate-binding protein